MAEQEIDPDRRRRLRAERRHPRRPGEPGAQGHPGPRRPARAADDLQQPPRPRHPRHDDAAQGRLPGAGAFPRQDRRPADHHDHRQRRQPAQGLCRIPRRHRLHPQAVRDGAAAGSRATRLAIARARRGRAADARSRDASRECHHARCQRPALARRRLARDLRHPAAASSSNSSAASGPSPAANRAHDEAAAERSDWPLACAAPPAGSCSRRPASWSPATPTAPSLLPAPISMHCRRALLAEQLPFAQMLAERQLTIQPDGFSPRSARSRRRPSRRRVTPPPFSSPTAARTRGRTSGPASWNGANGSRPPSCWLAGGAANPADAAERADAANARRCGPSTTRLRSLGPVFDRLADGADAPDLFAPACR